MYIDQLPEHVSERSKKAKRPGLRGAKAKAKGKRELSPPLSVEEAEAKLARLRSIQKTGR
jgi:hypothetical protein